MCGGGRGRERERGREEKRGQNMGTQSIVGENASIKGVDVLLLCFCCRKEEEATIFVLRLAPTLLLLMKEVLQDGFSLKQVAVRPVHRFQVHMKNVM